MIDLCVKLKDRSIAIATYALCGFSNISSMGIVLGGLSAMAPNKKTQLSSGVITAMISGSVACFITACIAGIQPTSAIICAAV